MNEIIIKANDVETMELFNKDAELLATAVRYALANRPEFIEGEPGSRNWDAEYHLTGRVLRALLYTIGQPE